MELKKWKQVSRIFNAALEIEAAKRFDFVVEACDGDTLLIVNTDGSGAPEKIGSRQLPDFFANTPAWSPDGKTIICPSLGGEVKTLAIYGNPSISHE